MMMRKLIMQGETKMANPIKAFNVKDGIIFWIIASALVLLWLLGFEVYGLGKWIHLVLLLALLGFGFGVHRGSPMSSLRLWARG